MMQKIERLVTLTVVMALLLLPGCKQGGLSTLFHPKAKRTETAQTSPASSSSTMTTTRSVPLTCNDRSLRTKDFDAKNPAWDKVWAACPASFVAGYNNVIQLMNKGETTQAAKMAREAADMHPDFAPLQELAQRLNDPYGYVGSLTDAKLKRWLSAKSRHEFTLKPPKKATPPSLPRLVKGEFEKRADFEARVTQAKQERAKVLRKIENDYENEVKAFNNAVSRHNKAVEQERRERMAAIAKMRIQYLEEALSEVFGDPLLVNPVYESESEMFYARLISSNGLLSEKVTVSVPLSQGKDFKQRVRSVKPIIPYEFKNGKLVRGVPKMVLGNRTYSALFTDETFNPVVMTAMADVQIDTGKQISTMKVSGLDMGTVLKEDDAYFGDALATQDDPRLAALKQKQAETNRQLREAKRERTIEAEIKRQQEELVAMGGTAGKDYEGLKEKRQWDFSPAKGSHDKTVVVIIGNRSYQKGIPLVHYAYNDAKAMRKFFLSGLGVPQQNVLYFEDATKGEMEGLFKRTLPNRVERGKSDVFVYFSGHGMPVDTKAMLLPTDARPDTADITGYSRDTMLMQLAALDAASVTVILDACFSGTTKGDEPLSVGKPVYKKPGVVSVPQNTVLISASRSNQISRMDEKSGMSLMTLYLLEGLSGKADGDGNKTVSVQEIRTYLEKEVSRVARIKFDMDQTPEVLGPANRALIVY